MELGGSRITHYSSREMSKMWGLKYVITDKRRGYKCLQKVKFGCKCAASLMSHLAMISYMYIFTFSESQVIIYSTSSIKRSVVLQLHIHMYVQFDLLIVNKLLQRKCI